ncbi:hypothetical protein BU17DRAFT_79954 [Hysterangium stoloniferum]|nr:hypothetical protein BU17DRAFT_79954 [Hysterangium stoloniferum]
MAMAVWVRSHQTLDCIRELVREDIVVAHVVPRSGPSPSPADEGGHGTGSSFFTFLVALLILGFASGALILRAVILRRRFRNRFREAIDAGILSRPTIPDRKPELYEINVSNAKNDFDLDSLMPVCATTLNETKDHDVKQTVDTPSLTPSLLTRMARLFRRQPQTTPTPDVTTHNDTFSADHFTKTSKVQVAVLIAMPSELLTIPQPELDDDSKGKRRNSSLPDEAMPDVMFGISSLSLAPYLPLQS